MNFLKQVDFEASISILQEEAEQLNRAFFHFVKHGKPYVTLKAVVTLDGRLSTRIGDSKWIMSEESRLMSITSATPIMQFWSAYKPCFMITLSSPPDCPMVERIQYVLFLNRHLRTPTTANVITDYAVATIIFTSESAEVAPAFSEFPLVTIKKISGKVEF